jgi:hypothetical protein
MSIAALHRAILSPQCKEVVVTKLLGGTAYSQGH